MYGEMLTRHRRGVSLKKLKTSYIFEIYIGSVPVRRASYFKGVSVQTHRYTIYGFQIF